MDHPRTRGVYGESMCPGHMLAGSSPHTRGLLTRQVREDLGGRIIPAHAGFTPRPGRLPASSADHPRTRGVYCVGVAGRCILRGSSPHTRGLPGRRDAGHGARGIIPAHAGFTTSRWPPAHHRQDHPRTRGVYHLPVGGWQRPAGSSPHTRGLRQHLAGQDRLHGIIPAHAGFTVGAPSWGLRWRDHPRTRGVYRGCPLMGAAMAGSSPHTRGLLPGQPGHPQTAGIIPAHAGFTMSRM